VPSSGIYSKMPSSGLICKCVQYYAVASLLRTLNLFYIVHTGQYSSVH